MPVIEIGFGEFWDRVTILKIKSERLQSPSKELAQEQLDALMKSIENLPNGGCVVDPKLCAKVDELQVINEVLWDVEDNIRRIRKSGRNGLFFDKDEYFFWASKVPVLNDLRARLKSEIDDFCGTSRFVDLKSYVSQTQSRKE